MKKNEEIQQVLSDMYYYLEHGITVGKTLLFLLSLIFTLCHVIHHVSLLPIY